MVTGLPPAICYFDEIIHKDSAYPGHHEAIIDRKTWDKAATLLAQNNNGNRQRGSVASGSLLTGILFDSAGNRYPRFQYGGLLVQPGRSVS